MFRISVVIPLYNKAPHIGRAIRSVLSQTEPDFEVIVVDDGSTDDGAAVVSALLPSDSRLKLVRQENQGVSAARNRGIAEASSDFIAFLDADDEWRPDHLETLLRLRARFPEAGAYATAYSYVNTRGRAVPGKFKAIPAPPWEGVMPDYFKSAALGDPPVTSSSVGVSKCVFTEIGPFRTGEKIGEDLDMWGRIALHKPIAFSWKGTSVYHLEATERAVERTPILADLPFVKTAEAHFNKTPMPRYVKLHVNEMRFRHINDLARSGRKKEALQKLCRMNLLASSPFSLARTLFNLVLPPRAIPLAKKIKRRFCRL